MGAWYPLVKIAVASLWVIFFGEPLTWTVCAGLATVVLGVAVMHGQSPVGRILNS